MSISLDHTYFFPLSRNLRLKPKFCSSLILINNFFIETSSSFSQDITSIMLHGLIQKELFTQCVSQGPHKRTVLNIRRQFRN